MNAFANGLAALHRDPNRSVNARFRPQRGVWREVRVIVTSRADPLATLGGRAARGDGLSVSLTAASLTTAPLEGDEIEITGPAGIERYTLSEIERDAQGLSYTAALTLAPGAPRA